MRRKNYKDKKFVYPMNNKRGQLAIFVIIALVIVGMIILLILFNRNPGPTTNIEVNPIPYLKSCIEPNIQMNVKELSANAGYSTSEGNLDYNGEKIKYLCYSSENYKTCVVQQPMIKEHFEEEISNKIKSKAQECLQNLRTEYDKKGYSVKSSNANINFSFNPGNMLLNFNAPMTISKGDITRSFNGFDIKIESQMYDLLMLSTSVIDFESKYGDSETTLYMRYYPDLMIEKVRLSEGSKVYTLSNVVTNESFRFATRSMVWPAGYGLS
jgi:hypothetical protein